MRAAISSHAANRAPYGGFIQASANHGATTLNGGQCAQTKKIHFQQARLFARWPVPLRDNFLTSAGGAA